MNNESGFLPLDMRVIVLPDPPETKIGSLHLTDAEIERRKWAQTKATLIAAGDNAFKDWASAAIPRPGQRVIVGQYTGRTHKGADGREYTICNDEDILALMEG